MSFRNLTSESPSFPKAKVPRYPMTMVPAAPVNPVRSEAQGLLAHSGVKAFMKMHFTFNMRGRPYKTSAIERGEGVSNWSNLVK